MLLPRIYSVLLVISPLGIVITVLGVSLYIDQLDMIAGNSDDPLHVVFLKVDGMAEHDDVAALHILVRQEEPAEKAFWRICQLVHNEMVAGKQRVVHRRRRNHERLSDQRSAEDEKQ